MEQIIITRPGKEDVNLLQRFPLRSVTKAEQTRKLLGEDVVSISVDSAEPVPLSIGDYLTAFGVRYTLNQLPNTQRISESLFRQDFTFEGPQYSLLRVLYLNLDSSGFSTTADFPLTGTLDIFVRVLMLNIVRVLGDKWKVADLPKNSPTKTLSFASENALAALQKICTEFETEFGITLDPITGAHTLSFGKQGKILDHTYEYGRGRGLYSLSRESFDGEAFVTRLYAYGGSRNIPSNYRNFSPRLKLDNGLSFLENLPAKNAFGSIEGSKTWENIYPRRTGKLSAVGTVAANSKTFSVTDTGLDFNLLEESGPPQTIAGKPVKQYRYLLPGTPAKVHFNSGNLAGYEFEVNDYNHGTKTLTLISFQNEQGQLIPSASSTAFQARPGDEYVLLDILMPDSYVRAAEAELRATAQNYLTDHSRPRVQYKLTVAEDYLKSQVTTLLPEPDFFALGDYLKILDTDLAIDDASRIVGFTRELLNPFRYTLEIADTYQVTTVERVLTDAKNVKTIIEQNNLNDPARARQNQLTTDEVLKKIFGAGVFFDPDKLIFQLPNGTQLPINQLPQTMIDGGLVTQGSLQLANDKNIVQAGISANGSTDSSVRFWAGKPYANRQTAPFRVNAAGGMIATSGRFGGWVINNSGIQNTDGKAFVIASSSTNPLRTEARIGASVFQAITSARGAAHLVASEPSASLDNYALVVDARNGRNNYALMAQTGIAQLGEALINGRRYLGQKIASQTLTIDPSQYDVVEVYPTTTNTGIRFGLPAKILGNGKMIVILNSNDSFNIQLSGIVRGNATYTLPGGSTVALLYSNNNWTIVSRNDSKYQIASPPFPVAPTNKPPVKNGDIPAFRTTSPAQNTFQIPANLFTDPDDELSYYVTSNLPDYISFDGGARRLTIDPDTALNIDMVAQIRVTDSASQSVYSSVRIVIAWPGLIADPNPPTDPGTPNPGTDGVLTIEDNNFSSDTGTPSGNVTGTGTAIHNGDTVTYIKITD